MEFKIPDSVILLFGTATKFDRDTVKLRATTTQGIYFSASCPALVINRKDKAPFTLSLFESLMEAAGRPTSWEHYSEYGLTRDTWEDVPANLEVMRAETTEMCGEQATRFEKRFVELFFAHLREQHEKMKRFADGPRRSRSLFNVLTPIPQAQFYCDDPLAPYTFTPDNNFRVDFAFWTGTKFIAVEIDGNEPGGYAQDIRRDRLLRRAGIDLVHILNTEIVEYPAKVIRSLLPSEILDTHRDGVEAGFPIFFPF
jgi:very-short-patch-repair endonuclease